MFFKKKKTKLIEIDLSKKTITIDIKKDFSLYLLSNLIKEQSEMKTLNVEYEIKPIEDGLKFILLNGWKLSPKTVRSLNKKDKRRYKRRTVPSENMIVQTFETRNKE